jgi:parvulin-like peptidyl-prolyl isomerase
MSPAQIKAQMGSLRKKAKEQAVGTRLLIEEASRLDFHIPPDYVERRLQTMVQNAGGAERFRALLGAQNLTEPMVRRSIEQGRRVDMLIEKVTEDVSEPTEKEMEAHFREHVKEYEKADRAEAQHILIRASRGDATAREAARAKLEGIRRELEDGADFSDLAAAHSDCPSGKKSGGSLGWFSRGMMVPEFDQAVFSMAVGEVSDIVETDLGCHLIHKSGHEAGGPPSFGEVGDKIREFLRHVRRGEAIAAHVEELKKKAVIEEE